MMYKKASVVVMFSLLFGVLGSALAVKHALAHGTMEDPIARAYQCYKENPAHPISAACTAAVAVNGTQPFYDWNGVNSTTGIKSIADGKLCSANHVGFEGLDLPRTDWVAKTISPDQNGNYTFVYLGTAPHATAYFDYYISKDSYDPTQPLKWSDLEFFCRANAPLVNSRYTMTCPLPNKPGNRVIYNVWQRSDSPEAFYACIDVVIQPNGAAATATPAAATATPTKVAPTATPQPSVTPTPTKVIATTTPASATPTPTKVVATATPQPGATTTPGAPTPTLIPTRPGNDTSAGTIKAYLPLVTK